MFNQKIMKVGGSLCIIIPNKEAEFEGFEEGDWVKVIIKKNPKYSNQEDYEKNEKEVK